MKNDIIRCECVDMSVDGLGIAKHDGLVIFVKKMIPGEIADVKIILEKKNYSIGIIDKLIKVSDNRRDYDCPVAYKCGGCDFRHISYEYQLQLKENLLKNTLADFKITNIIKADNPYHYRNKVQMPFRNNKMGFYRKNTNDIVECDNCLIESELANEILKDLKSLLIDENINKHLRHIIIKHGKKTNEVMLCFVSDDFNIDLSKVVNSISNKYPMIKSIILNLNDKDTNVIIGEKEKILYGVDYIYDELDGLKIKISLKSFYQVNHEQMLKLYNKVLELSSINFDCRVLDLYCGIGTISLYLSRFSKSVTGVEIVKEAVSNAIDNARMNNIENAEFILADASRNMDEYLLDKDVVIVDPPRKGISKELINSLKNSNIKTIVYVSCNPATLNRDLHLLKDTYDIGTIYPVDMFPFTTHVEAVCCLQIKK